MEKVVAEGCVKYDLHFPSHASTSETLDKRLDEVIHIAQQLVDTLCNRYIWQVEPFKLEKTRIPRPHLSGTTRFGDSVEDEWLIVYILRRLGRICPDVWTQISDSDQQFLLVEASVALPKWMDPDSTDNRIWINTGKLLYIPPGSRNLVEPDSLIATPLNLDDAITCIQHERDSLVHDLDLEKAAFGRLTPYPEQMNQNLHHTVITIPRKLALILQHAPQSISQAIAAFDVRDPISLKPLRLKHKDLRADSDSSAQDFAGYRLVFPPRDMINMTTTFNRLGYAQLRSQEFDCPPSWKTKLPLRSAPNYKRAETGMRVSAGYEMLVADVLMRKHVAVQQILLLLQRAEKGELAYPSNDQIGRWPKFDDPEDWMEVDLAELENMRQRGHHHPNKRDRGVKREAPVRQAEKSDEAELRDLASRFSAFIDSSQAGVEGVEELEEVDDSGSDLSSDDGDPVLESDDWEAIDGEMDPNMFDSTMGQMMDLSPEDILIRNKTLGLEEIEAGNVRPLTRNQRKPTAGFVKKPNTGHSKSGSSLPVFGPPRPPSMLPFPEHPAEPKPQLHEQPGTAKRVIPKSQRGTHQSAESFTTEECGADGDEEADLSENEVFTDLVQRFGEELKKMGAMGLEDPDMKAALKKASRIDRYRDRPQDKRTEVASSGSEAEDDDPRPASREAQQLNSDPAAFTAPNPTVLNERFSIASEQMKRRLQKNEDKAKAAHSQHKAPAPGAPITELESSDDEAKVYDDLDGSNDDDDDGALDAQLAKNMLASLKAQGSRSGPAGNMLGMMGIQMPRDEDSDLI